jgi:hypothetical protein
MSLEYELLPSAGSDACATTPRRSVSPKPISSSPCFIALALFSIQPRDVNYTRISPEVYFVRACIQGAGEHLPPVHLRMVRMMATTVLTLNQEMGRYNLIRRLRSAFYESKHVPPIPGRFSTTLLFFDKSIRQALRYRTRIYYVQA